jgi:hypothetical protein
VEPLCLVINGPSAAGKSTLTTTIQDLKVGQGVIVDGQAFEPEANRDLEARLRKVSQDGAATVAIVELTTDDGEREDRQCRHRHPAGLSLFHNSRPPQSARPDLIIDTTGLDASRKRADSYSAGRTRPHTTGLWSSSAC